MASAYKNKCQRPTLCATSTAPSYSARGRGILREPRQTRPWLALSPDYETSSSPALRKERGALPLGKCGGIMSGYQAS
eukprot:337797-Prymnesium_polylepis.1